MRYPVREKWQPLYVEWYAEISYRQSGWHFQLIPSYTHTHKAGFLTGISPAQWKMGMYFGMYYYMDVPYQEVHAAGIYQTP